MRQSNVLFTLALLVMGSSSQAQFPIVATGSSSLTSLSTLSSGVKFMDFFMSNTEGAGTRTLYDLDMTVFRVLNYPAPPEGKRWAAMFYITESLFDTDPSTVEFILTASPLDGPGDFATFVFREDGTQLFVQDPGSFTGTIGSFMASGAPIFSTEEGTYMIVHTSMVLGPPVNIYELPGTLPCLDCKGTPTPDAITTDLVGSAGPFSGMSILPNPAQTQVQVRFSERAQGADRVVLFDAAGREVSTTRVNGESTLQLDVQQLASGRYTVVALNGPTSIGTVPLLISR